MKEACRCATYSIVYYCNDAQWYEHVEQFLQVGRLYQALILLGLALCLLSTSVSLVITMLYIIYYEIFCYIFLLNLLVN